MNQAAKRIIFTGRVQGIGFRFTALDTANRLDLVGTVRNLPNGTVEMMAQGPAQDIDDCIRNIEQSLESYIKQTKIEEIPLNPQYKDFGITF